MRPKFSFCFHLVSFPFPDAAFAEFKPYMRAQPAFDPSSNSFPDDSALRIGRDTTYAPATDTASFKRYGIDTARNDAGNGVDATTEN